MEGGEKDGSQNIGVHGRTCREICNAIKMLSKEMAKAQLITNLTLYGGGKVIETNHFEIVDGMKQAFVKLAQAEIDKLEKQLADL